MRTPLRSMTGFAAVEGSIRGLPFRAEIKAFNHRHLDLKLRLPRALSGADLPIRNLVQKQVARGSVDLKIEPVQDLAQETAPWRLNKDLLRHYCAEARALARELGLEDRPPALGELLSLPEAVVRSGEAEAQETPISADEVAPLLSEALSKLLAMRETEGEALRTVLRQAVEDIERRTAELRRRRRESQDTYRRNLTARIGEVFEAHPVTDGNIRSVLESRVAQELALLLDRTDVEEELSRLEGHLSHFLETLTAGSPAGRKLDFLLQEMNREVNTLGNKAQDYGISSDVVELKVIVEQLREQALNVE